MAKFRKTKKEKLRSSERISHTTAAQPSADTPQSSEHSSVFTFVSSSNASAIHTRQIPATTMHLKEDMLRTVTVIGAIIIAELILYYTLAVR